MALWGLLLLGIIQIIVSIILYLAISTWLEDAVNDNLVLTVNQIALVFYTPDEPQNPLDIADARSQLTNNSNIATQSFLRDQHFFVRLIDLSNSTVLASSADNNLPAPRTQVIPASFDTFSFYENDKFNEIRMYTLPLSYAPRFALQVGVSLEETRKIQGDVLRIVIVLLLFTGTLAPLSGWFLANRALVPIRATARTAARINETDLTQRLDLASSEVELEQLVQTFNAMLDRIEHAFQRQRQFTTDAAHELRTPLSIMQTGLDVTLSQVRSVAEYRHALTSVQEEVQRLSQLANTLLMLARADTHDLPLQTITVDLSLMLNTVAEQFDSLADEKHIAIERIIARDLMIQGDEDQLIQVVFNLVDNAIKYSPSGGKVRIMAREYDHQIEIMIEDTGSGISGEEQRLIFDRFYRSDQSRNRNQGGFGLGLAIAKRIVGQHNGSIRVVSKMGYGSQFIVTLPLQSDLIPI